MSYNLPFAVNQLLRDNDCVIIPGFGGFIAKYSDAKIDLDSLEMSPPSKVIAFNQELLSDDKLLVNYICEVERVSTEIALEYIKSFIEDFYKKLENQKQLSFGDLGIFHLTNDNIIFKFNDEINLLNSSFGLHKFHYPMLKKHGDIKIKPKTILSKSSSSDKKKKDRSISKKVLIGISTAAVITGLLFLSNYFGVFDNIQVVHSAKIANFTVFSSDNDFSPEAGINHLEEIKEKKYDYTNLHNDLMEADKQEITEDLSEHHSTQITTTSDFRNHVIAGSFNKRSNAVKLQNDLIYQGYNSTIFDAPNGMYRVSLKSYAEKNEAINDLSSLKSEIGNQDLWVWIKR